MPKFLRLNLQFFAAEGAAGGEGSTEGAATGEGTGGSWVDEVLGKETEDTPMIPKKRFDDVNNRYKALNDDYKNRQTEYEEMTKQLEESDATKKQLEETIETGKQRIETLEGVIKSMFDAELEQIDEEYRELVPSDKTIEEQLDWLRKAKQKGLFASRGMEFEIGQMSNPRQSGRTAKGHENMNPIQLLTMGYSNN